MKKVQIDSSNDENVMSDIILYFIKWIGIVICMLCIAGFFVDSNWLVETRFKTFAEYSSNDSDASKLLMNIELKMLDLLKWLKNLTLSIKIIGIIIGGVLFSIGNKGDS